MSSQPQQLLVAMLTQQADFETHQLLKADRVGDAADRVIETRRKRIRLQQILFMAFTGLPLLAHSLALAFFPSLYLQDASVILASVLPFSFLALMQVPGMIESRVSLARLETLLTLWLVETEGKGVRTE